MTKDKYETPHIELVKFECEDVITSSVLGDDNIGEWDPQTYSVGGRIEEGR